MTCAEASELTAMIAEMSDEELAAAGKMTRAQIDRLCRRDRTIVLRHVAGDKLGEIGADMGLCKERVRQLRDRAIAVVRARLERGGDEA